jgi:hypothetical protein
MCVCTSQWVSALFMYTRKCKKNENLLFVIIIIIIIIQKYNVCVSAHWYYIYLYTYYYNFKYKNDEYLNAYYRIAIVKNVLCIDRQTI